MFNQVAPMGEASSSVGEDVGGRGLDWSLGCRQSGRGWFIYPTNIL